MEILSEYLAALGTAAALSAVFFALERRTALAGNSRREYVANYLYFPFYLAGVYLLQLKTAPLFAQLSERLGGGLLTGLASPKRAPAVEVLLTVAFVFIWDVWQYWIHRWQHTSSILWEVHKLHHSDPALNSSSQGRHHVLNYVLNVLCYAPIVLLFGSFGPHVFVAFLMFRLWGFVNHADIRVSFGPLTTVIAGPQWHRIHHSTQQEHFDRNFATFFPFIDRMFGTYYAPAESEYPPTGLPAGRAESFIQQATISPFVGYYRALRRWLAVEPAGDRV
jgi:sterol desaturase/sphingolipid hydroxylase (fatty acid hydroxylase superfamily)